MAFDAEQSLVAKYCNEQPRTTAELEAAFATGARATGLVLSTSFKTKLATVIKKLVDTRLLTPDGVGATTKYSASTTQVSDAQRELGGKTILQE